MQVIDLGTSELLCTFKTCRDESTRKLAPDEPPITKMFPSSDGQWVAAVNCFGDIYVYNLEIQRYVMQLFCAFSLIICMDVGFIDGERAKLSMLLSMQNILLV